MEIEWREKNPPRPHSVIAHKHAHSFQFDPWFFIPAKVPLFQLLRLDEFSSLVLHY